MIVEIAADVMTILGKTNVGYAFTEVHPKPRRKPGREPKA
jgi:hypothetical protein